MDKINGAIYSKEQELFVEFFPKDQHYQIFYNKGTRCMIFRQKKQLFQISVDSQSISKMEIPFEGPIYDLQIHKKERYVAYSIAHNLLGIVYLKGKEGKETRLKISKDDKMDPIIHFEWIYGCSRSVDFVLCKQSGLVLYKIDIDKQQLKEQKTIPLDISACWFDPINEILCCANTYEDGKIHPFYFSEKRQGYKYKGIEFKVESGKKDAASEKARSGQQSSLLGYFTKQYNKLQSKFETVNFVTVGDNRNKDLTLIPRDLSVFHKISLVVLYGKTFLVYMNPFHNKIFLYQLNYEKVTLCEFNIVSPAENGIRFSVADNLLIIHSTTENLSLVYDVRSKTNAYQIGPPQCLEIHQDRQVNRKNTIVLDLIKSKNDQEDDDEYDSEDRSSYNGTEVNRQISGNYSDPRFSTQSTVNSQHFRHSQDPNQDSTLSHQQRSNRKTQAAVKAAVNSNSGIRQSLPLDIKGESQNTTSNFLGVNNNQNKFKSKYDGIFDNMGVSSSGDLNKSVEINIIDPQLQGQINVSNDSSHFDLHQGMNVKKTSLLEDEEITAQQIQQSQQQTDNLLNDQSNLSNIPNITVSDTQQNNNETLINDIDLLSFNNTQNQGEQSEKDWNQLLSTENLSNEQNKMPSYKVFDQNPQVQNFDQTNASNNDPLDLIDDDTNTQVINSNNQDINPNNQDISSNTQVINSNTQSADIAQQNTETTKTQNEESFNKDLIDFDHHAPINIIDVPENYFRIENSGQIYQLDKNAFTEDEFIINCKERKFNTIKVDINRIEKLATDEKHLFTYILVYKNQLLKDLMQLQEDQIVSNMDFSTQDNYSQKRKILDILDRYLIRYQQIIKRRQFQKQVINILKQYKYNQFPNKKEKVYEVIDPNDIYELFFKYLSNDPQTNKNYLTELLAEYIKQSIVFCLDFFYQLEHEITVDIIFQNHLAKLLIQQQKFNTFLFYVQYRVITDDEELAVSLINMHQSNKQRFSFYKIQLSNSQLQIGLGFKQGFQLGLDMLFRLRKHTTIVTLQLKRGLALDYMRKQNVNRIGLKDMIKIFLNQKGDMSLESINEYFKETISKSRGNEKFGFSYLEFVEELQIQQNQKKQVYTSQHDLI